MSTRNNNDDAGHKYTHVVPELPWKKKEVKRKLYGFGVFELNPNGSLTIIIRDGTSRTHTVTLYPGDEVVLASNKSITYVLGLDNK